MGAGVVSSGGGGAVRDEPRVAGLGHRGEGELPASARERILLQY